MGKTNEKSKRELFKKSIVTGIAGALLWGMIGSFAYMFNFSEVSHATFTLRSFFSGGWTEGITGELISLVIVSLLGAFPAIIYYFLFKNFPRVVHGIIYGLFWWALVFIVIQPFFSYAPTIGEMNPDTLATSICLFVLYGVFVGYTISFEANNERITFQD